MFSSSALGTKGKKIFPYQEDIIKRGTIICYIDVVKMIVKEAVNNIQTLHLTSFQSYQAIFLS